MRVLAVLLVLMSVAATAAPRDTRKRRTSAKKPQAVASSAPAPAPSPEVRGIRTDLALGAGGFLGGGLNRGVAVGATVTLTPGFADGRFALDLDLNWRMTSFRASVENYGTLSSTLHALPLVPALRFRAFQLPMLVLDVRGGLGPLLVIHQTSSDFGQSVTRSALGWEAFVAGQVRVPVSAVELFADLRLGLGEAHIPRVLGQATGAQALLGVRYALP